VKFAHATGAVVATLAGAWEVLAISTTGINAVLQLLSVLLKVQPGTRARQSFGFKILHGTGSDEAVVVLADLVVVGGIAVMALGGTSGKVVRCGVVVGAAVHLKSMQIGLSGGQSFPNAPPQMGPPWAVVVVTVLLFWQVLFIIVMKDALPL
jgi:hypothetical protein